MGFISSLLGLPDVKKMMAAQNALMAKAMYMMSSPDSQQALDHTVKCLLLEGGISHDSVDRQISNMPEAHYFCMVAAAFNRIDVRPAFQGISFKDNWNFIDRPLAALYGANKEIHAVSKMLYDKHGVTIHLDTP